MAETTILTGDPKAGLETPDGHTFKPDSYGRIRVPGPYADYAEKAAATVPFFSRPGKLWSGVDMAELRARAGHPPSTERRPDAPCPDSAPQEG